MQRKDIKNGAKVQVTYGTYDGCRGTIKKALDVGTTSSRAMVKIVNGNILTFPTGWLAKA